MRAFLISIVAAVTIATGAMFLLERKWQQTSDEAFTSTTNARFPHQENSHNLVGRGWQSAADH
jgi:hypothetical protein